MLVLDAVGQVDPVRQAAYLRLDDMRGGGRTVRYVPLILPVEEGRLFLRPRQGDAKVLVGAYPKRVAGKIGKDACDILIARRAGIDGARCARRGTVWKELQ